MEVMNVEPCRMDKEKESRKRRRAEDEAEEASKHRKHHKDKDKDKDKDKQRHHRHHKHKHHHHKKNRSENDAIVAGGEGDTIEKEEDFRVVRVSADEEKEEGEIVEEEEVAIPAESEIESGEIPPEEMMSRTIDQDFNSAASKLLKTDEQETLKDEFLGFSKSSDKKDFSRSTEDMDRKIPIEKKIFNERSSNHIGKADTNEVHEQKFFEYDMTYDNHELMSGKIVVDRVMKDGKQYAEDLKDTNIENGFKHANYHSQSRHKREAFPESINAITQEGHSAYGNSGKVQDHETSHNRYHHKDHQNDQRRSQSPVKVTDREKHRRGENSESVSEDIEQERKHRHGQPSSPLKYTEIDRLSKEEHLQSPSQSERHTGEGNFKSRGINKDRPLNQDKSKSPDISGDIYSGRGFSASHDRHKDRVTLPSRDRYKDKVSSPLQERRRDRVSSPLLERHRDRVSSPLQERHRDRVSSPSRDKYRDGFRSPSQDRHRERVRSPIRDRHREKAKSPSRERHRDRMRTPSRERHRDRMRTPSRERHRDRVRSPSREKNRDGVRSPSREKHQDRVRSPRLRSPSRDRQRERGRSPSRDMFRDRNYGDTRERARDMQELRKRSRSRERELRQNRSSWDYSSRARRSDSRENTRSGRIDDHYDRHHRYGHERHSDRDRQRDKISERDNHLKHRESTQEAKEDRENFREEEDQEEYQERVAMQLAEQEEDDVEKIKEESRKRRHAILEKYRQQKQESQMDEQGSQVARKEDGSGSSVDNATEENNMSTQMSVGQPEQMIGLVDNGLDGNDIFIPDPAFSVGKDALKNGIPPVERVLSNGGLGEGSPKGEVEADMFSDDIFGETPARIRKPSKGDGLPVDTSGLHDNWDDAEGYYGYRIGEVLDSRYEIIAAHGKGVFSSVVRAKDLKAGNGEPEEVAIKIIRNNETMYKAGQEELVILKKLAGADPEDKRHCVRFLSSFKYRNHLCLVFESLHMNLREVLKKFGRNIGLNLTAVRAYAKQLFIALKHLKNCGVLHCDIKPDNMLVNDSKNVLKLCDFGNAMFAGKNEITPYLVSRFYRAPEIILGLSYDHAMDIWSVGCCLFELYVGKVLFPGPTNNDMLRLHMELKGPFPKKMLRKGSFTDQHFDHDLNFHATEEDPVSKKIVKRLMVNIKPKDIGGFVQSSSGEDLKMLSNFKDLLERIFILDPDKRLTVSQALSHPFITGK